jgi:hypothetical protein
MLGECGGGVGGMGGAGGGWMLWWWLDVAVGGWMSLRLTDVVAVGVCLDDAASAEPRRYLSHPLACNTSNDGLTVKRVLYCRRKRSGVRIRQKTNVFLH